MANFLDPQPPNQGVIRAYVHPARKDGRHPVTFVYPVSGRRIRKLIPADRLDAMTRGYVVIHVPA